MAPARIWLSEYLGVSASGSSLSAPERIGEIGSALDQLAVAAVGARERREVRVAQIGARHPGGVVALLMHADRAVHAVVGDDPDHRKVVLRGRRQLLPGHEKAAVAGEAYDGAFRVDQLGRDRRRRAVAHRAAGRAELRAIAPVLVVAVDPDTVVAGAVSDDRVIGQVIGQPAHYFAELDVTGSPRRLERGEVLCVRHPGLFAPR
jgi:hypothetical protein